MCSVLVQHFCRRAMPVENILCSCHCDTSELSSVELPFSMVCFDAFNVKFHISLTTMGWRCLEQGGVCLFFVYFIGGGCLFLYDSCD